MVEGDEFFEELVVGEVFGPAVGLEDGGVQVVVELFEEGDQAAVVDLFVLGREFGGGHGALVGGAEFFEDVVHVGEGGGQDTWPAGVAVSNSSAVGDKFGKMRLTNHPQSLICLL